MIKDRAWYKLGCQRKFSPLHPARSVCLQLDAHADHVRPAQPAFEKVGAEQRNGQTWLHIRLKVADAKVDPKTLPQYWLVLDAQGQALYVGHTDIPMFSRGSTARNSMLVRLCSGQEKIAPPPLGPPVDEKAHGFNDIEQHKFDWAKKIVRIEVDPKLSAVGTDRRGISHRAFLKRHGYSDDYGWGRVSTRRSRSVSAIIAVRRAWAGNAHGLERKGAPSMSKPMTSESSRTSSSARTRSVEATPAPLTLGNHHHHHRSVASRPGRVR